MMSLGEVLKDRTNNERISEGSTRPGEVKPTLRPSLDQIKGDIDLSKPKIVTMIPKCMSTIPSNPFSMGAPVNPMSGGLPQSGMPQPNFSAELSRNSVKSGSREEERQYYLPQTAQLGPHRRFSLNPLSYMAPNMDPLERKYGIEIGNKNLNRSGQEERNNENSLFSLERRFSHKPSANVSLGAYGYDPNERRLY